MSLKAIGVSHSYQSTKVLRGVNLAIEEGQSVALMGPSGSGKTTLLSILGFLTTPSEGAVILDQGSATQPQDSSEMRRSPPPPSSLGWIFQSVNSLKYRTALDNVSLPLLAMGYDRSTAALVAESALDKVGLRGLGTALAHTLSGGELQRVCVARALVSKPRILLADEPTGHLDRTNTGVVLDALWALKDDGTAVVIATHDPEVALRCERRFLLTEGKVIQE